MGEIEERFRDHFAPWGITIPPGHVRERRRGKIVEAGWTIWYLFGEDERGEYLDYYASHRMTNDRHIRIREDGAEEYLPTVSTMRLTSRTPRRTPGSLPSTSRRIAAWLRC